MSRRNKNLGDWGEEQACNFLQRHGFQVVERNYFTSVGEIDIIARQGDDFYFIEVKTRRCGSLSFNTAITAQQQAHLARAITKYCYDRDIKDCSLIKAGLVVAVDKARKRVKLHFCVLY